MVKSKWVQVVTVIDPDTNLPVEVEIRKLETGLMVGFDGCYLEQLADGEQPNNPYDRGKIFIPDDEVTTDIQPGKAGTVPSAGLHSAVMGDGEGKPTRIIKDGRVFQYVGIGWVNERNATQEDADDLPVVVYPEISQEHRVRS